MKDAWCKHYNGMALNNTCKIGIKYERVLPVYMQTPRLHMPCFTPHVTTCELREYPTQEEIEREEAAVNKIEQQINDFSARRTEDCPHCGKHVDKLNKIGRCTYARPCGCRLWQGTIPEAWR